MSKKKKEKYRAQQQSSSQPQQPGAVSIPPAQSTPLSAQEPAAVIREMNFDSMEEKIRGEDVLAQHENSSSQEEQKIKKALDKSEVDRRLEELRRQLGLKK